jgi:hypothetical protein
MKGMTGMMRARTFVSSIAITGAVLCAWTAAPAHAVAQSTSPKQWANGVCSAVQTFGQSVDSTITSLKGSGSLDAATQQAKDGLDSALKQLEDSLQKLGKPTTSDGTKAQSALQDLSTGLTSDVNAIQQSLSPPPSDPADVAATFAEIGSTIQKGVSQTKATANTLKGLKPNGTLRKAFQNAPACKSLKSSL